MEKNYSFKKKSGLNFKKTLLTCVLFLSTIVATSTLYAQICSINALNDQTICETQELILGNAGSINETNANTPVWTQISGPSVSIVNPNNETTSVVGIVGGNTYTFQLSAICTVDGLQTFDDVTITVTKNTKSNAGADIEGCSGSYSLAANAPAAGETGTWTRVSGPGVNITDINSETSTVTLNPLTPGTTVLRWTISNPNCSNSSTMSIVNYGGDPTVDAGSDRTLSECFGSTTGTTLDASVGGILNQSGTWSVVSRTGATVPVFSNVNSNTSNVSNLSEGTYTLRWTVAGSCVTGTDTVVITVPAATQDVTTATGINLDQRYCLGVTSAVLEGNTPLYAGETVEWTQTSGPVGATITSPNSPTTTVTGLDGSSDYTFSYRITGPPLGGTETCSTSENFRVRFYNDPVSVLLDGGNNSVILPANATSGSVPITYTGGSSFDFQKISGPAGSGTQNLSVTGGNTFNFSGLDLVGTYVFRVTRQTNGQIGTGCGTASDDISIFVSRDTDGTDMAANAGTDPVMACNQVTTNLNANDPTITPVGDNNTYTAYWTQVAGPNSATIADVNLYNTGISNLIPGLYTFRWHMSGGVGATDSTDDVDVLVGSNTNSEILLPRPNECAGDVLFQAEPLGVSETGVWTQISGPTTVTFLDATNPLTYGNLAPSSEYVFRWVVTNSSLPNCDYYTEVTVSTNSGLAPSPAIAGVDQCLATGVTSVTMAADNTDFGITGTTGTWTLFNGPNTPAEIASDPNNPTVTFTGLVPGLYTFEWTTSNTNPCVTTFSETVDVYVSDPTIYSAGTITDICTTNTTAIVNMGADDPSALGLTGVWIQKDGSNSWSVDNINSPTAVFSDLTPGYYEFEWSVEKGSCDTSKSTVSFNVNLQAGPATLNTNTAAVCGDTYSLVGVAEPVSNGTGTWSLASGPNTPTISDLNSEDLEVSGLVTGTYVFRWSVTSNNPFCTPSAPDFADFTLTVSAPATAGTDQDLCNANTVLLQGNQGGVGTWSMASSTGGPAPVITTISDNTASATITPGFDYVFTYTLDVAPGCGSQSADVAITNNAPPEVPNAGADFSHCLSSGTSFTMNATALTFPSEGTWTQQLGPTTVNFTDENLNNTTVSNLANGLYIFEWNSNNGGNCGDLSDFVSVNVYGEPTAVINTPVGTACQFNTVLEAQTPAFGIGTWTLTSTPPSYVSGNMSIDSPNNPTTDISIVNPHTLALGDYEFTWTVTNGTCADAVDTVILTYNGVPPTTPYAGPDQELCDASTVTMQGNTISPGTGTWTQVGTSPSVAIITNKFDPNTTISGLVDGTYQFMWTANNGGCSFSDTVEVTIVESTAPADAGPDQNITQFDNLIMAGNDPTPLTGNWTFVSGPTTPVIIDSNDPTTQITGIIPGTYEFTWTVENSPCATSSDNVIINILPIVDLSLTKSIVGSVAPYFVGDELIYNVTVTNNSTSFDGTGVSVTDNLPSGFTIVPGTISNGGVYNSISNTITWTGLTIPAASDLDLAYNVTIKPTGDYDNNAEIVASDNLDPNSTPDNGDPLEDDYDEVVIIPNPLVNIALNKTIDNPTPLMGSNVIFTLTVSNSGPNDATNVVVTDYLPDGFTYVSDSPSVGSTSGNPTIVWSVGNLANGASETIEITATVTTSGNYKNITEVTNIGSPGSPEKDSNSTPDNGDPLEDDYDSVEPVPVPAADLELTKTVNDPTPNVGERVTFTITVTNQGPNVATNVDVYDYLPTGFSYVSHTVNTVANDVSYTPVTGSWITPTIGVGDSVILTVDALVLPMGQYTNFAEVVGVDQEDPDSIPGNNDIVEDDHDAAYIVPINIADLVTVKTVSAVSVTGSSANNPNEGDVIRYSITVNNNGGPTAATGVSLTDILPVGVTYVTHTVTAGTAYNQASGVWTIGDIAVDDTKTLTIDVSVNVGTQGTSIVNNATAATGDQTDPTDDGNDLDEEIDVNAFPIAEDDISSGHSHATEPSVTINLINDNSNGVDTDPDGTVQVSTITITSPGATDSDANGTLDQLIVPGEGVWTVDNANGEITFTTEVGFTGDPTPITYTIEDNDGDVSNEATVSIYYVAIPPVAVNDESLGNTPGDAVTIDVLIDNIVATGVGNDDVDSDADGSVDPKTVSLVIPVPSVTVTNVSIDSEGDVIGFTVPGEGNWSVDPLSGAITFTPLSTFNDDPTVIEYTIKDNDGNKSNNATVTIDYVPVATNDINTVVGVIGSPVSIDVTLNDLDGDVVDPRTVVLDATSVGGVQVSSSEVSLAGVGVWLDNGSGIVTFTPEAGYTLDPPVIEYTIQDDEGNISNEATITFDYEPKAENDERDNGGQGYDANEIVTVDVLDNDTTGDIYNPTTVSLVDPGTAINIVTDANGDITSYEIPGEGTWNVDLVTGAITFDPEDGFILSPTPIFYNVEDDEGNQSNDAQVTIIYVAQADIEVVKTDNSDTYTPGEPIVYTITVTNNGPANAADVIVNDDIVAGLEASTSWTGTNGSSGSGDIADTIATLNSGDTVTYTVTVNVPSAYTGDIVNTATAALPPSTDSTMPVDTDPSNNESTDTDEMNAQSALVVDKTVDNPTPNVGSEVTFTITVTNMGPSDATGIDVLDVLPTGYTLSTTTVPNPSQGTYTANGPDTGLWNLGGLVAYGSVGVSEATLTVTATVNESGNYTNTAEIVKADQDDPNSIHGNNDPKEDDQAEVTPVPTAITNLITTKSVDNSTPNVGDIITYTITVVNNGPSVATGVNLIDNLPVGLEYVTHLAIGGSVNTYADVSGDMTWTIGIIDIGESATLTIDALVTAEGTFDQTPITNITTPASGGQVDPTTDGDDLEEDITVTSADLVTIKTVNNTTPEEGDVITYSIEVTNNGPSDATGVSLTDLLPAGVTYVSDNQGNAFNSGSGIWTVGNIANGATATLNITATVDVNTAGTSIQNLTTAAEGDQSDPTTEGDDLDATIEVENYADIVLTKVVDNATPNVGDIVTYEITVTNNGPAKVTNLVVTDALPTGLTYVPNGAMPSDGTWTAPNWNVDLLESGEFETLVIKAQVGMDQGGMTLTNVVSNTQDQVDSDLTEDDDRETIVVTSSDLVTVKTVSDATPSEGDTITYMITVTNNGPSDATGVSLTDLLPAGVTYVSDDQGDAFNSGSGIWTVGSINNGATATLNISATVDVDTAGMSITNSTTAAEGDQSDPTTDGDALDATIDVESFTDIVLTKVVDNSTPNAGDTVTYTVTVRNNGPAKVTGLIVTDAFPSGLTYGIVSPSDGTWAAPNWSLGTLESGEEETIVIEAIVGIDQGGQTLTNTVSNSQDQEDSNLTEDDASETIIVTSSDLVTIKTVSNATPNEGDTITYTIAVTNNGPSTATNVSLIDNLPVGVTFVSHSTTEGAFNYGSGLWSIGDLANGTTATLVITATVDDGTLGQTITNTTSAVIADQSDPDTTNNIGNVSIVPTAYIDLSLTKWVVDDVEAPEVGDEIRFEIRVNNEGPTEATGVQVTDLIPSGYDFVNYSSSIGTYNPVTGLWNIGFIEIGNTAVLIVDVIVMESGDYQNCAEITAANEIDIDSTPNNGDATEDDYDCAAAPPIQELDLKVEKTVIADNLTPMVGDEVSFEIRLINDGNIDGTEVVVTDLLPTGYTYFNYSSTRGTYDDDTGKWIVGTIEAGETEVLVIDAIVNAAGDYLNCATITEMHQTDTDLSNNTSCIATNPIKVIDLELTKEVALSIGNQGPVSTTGVLQPYAETNVDFTITVSNNGPSDATGVQVTDLLPNGYNFVDATVSIGTYDDGSGIWNVGTIVNGASETLIITAYVNPIGNWLNVAEVTAANELDIDSTPNNGDIFEDDMDQIATEPIIPLTIPEGFTPNGDGINDVFEIEFLEILYPNFAMEIVNRYGNKVYEYEHNGNPYQTPQWWDGYSTGRWNFSSDQLPAGTYFYTIYFNNDDRKPQTGWVYLRK